MTYHRLVNTWFCLAAADNRTSRAAQQLQSSDLSAAKLPTAMARANPGQLGGGRQGPLIEDLFQFIGRQLLKASTMGPANPTGLPVWPSEKVGWFQPHTEQRSRRAK